MNWIDGIIVGVSGFAFYNGFRRGAVIQVFSWGGFIAGIFIGGILAPPLVRAFNPKADMAQFSLSLGLFLIIAFVVEAIVAVGGARLARYVTGDVARRANQIVGSVVAGLSVLAVSWLAASPVKRTPLEQDVRASSILRGLDAVLPPAPNVIAQLGGLLSRTGFPEVFAQLNPSLVPDVEPPPASLARERAVLAAARFTYKIQSRGCGGQVNGSGFPVGRDMVVTAAHVVAGTRGTMVLEASDAGGSRFPATVVYIDTRKDIAILHVPDLKRQRLDVEHSPASRNSDGAAIGYPGGGDRRISVARVRARTDALGRDIYSRRQVTRQIYVLRASVRQGNSGGPFVDTDGRVRGMIFAASASSENESYALTETEIDRAMDRARGKTSGVDTGRCAI